MAQARNPCFRWWLWIPGSLVSLAPRNDDLLLVTARRAGHLKKRQSQKEKDQLALAQYGDKLPANRPDPDDPGGLGAEESGTERTGPTQYPLVATQRGGRLAEVGQQ